MLKELSSSFAGVIGKRPPDPLAAAHADGQAVGIMHLRAEVVEAAARVLAEPEHAGHRGDAEAFDFAAGEKHGLHLDDRLVSGKHLERVGSGVGRAVEQGVKPGVGVVGLVVCAARTRGIPGIPRSRPRCPCPPRCRATRSRSAGVFRAPASSWLPERPRVRRKPRDCSAGCAGGIRRSRRLVGISPRSFTKRAVVEISLRQTDLLLMAVGEFIENRPARGRGSRDGKTWRGTAGCRPPTRPGSD